MFGLAQSGPHPPQGFEAPTPWLRRQPPTSCSAHSWDCAWQRLRPPPVPAEPWPAPSEPWPPEAPASPHADASGFCIPPDRSVLIKNCLKLTIRQRREALGLGDIAPDFKTAGPEEDRSLDRLQSHDAWREANSHQSPQRHHHADAVVLDRNICQWLHGVTGLAQGPHPLTQEDEEKRSKRRERNKIAASKCRNRKKERTVRLSEESEDLQRGNAELRRELQRLRQEVQHLSHLLRVHVCIAPGASGSR
ncbi:cyclic AMP-dependent transcription factor ATF-3 [Ixodes scapularis]